MPPCLPASSGNDSILKLISSTLTQHSQRTAVTFFFSEATTTTRNTYTSYSPTSDINPPFNHRIAANSTISNTVLEPPPPPTMQRPSYGQSPPLHHPVPQHVSTVPQLRSPPPPVSQTQSQGYDGSPYQQQQARAPSASGNSNVFGQYGNFMNDPAAQLASQFGQTAFRQGQEYLEHNVSAV